jgi:hypothetical protein
MTSRQPPKGEPMNEPPLERVRVLCLGFPETDERPSHGMPTFFVRGKKAFVNYADNHHGDGRLALWCNAPPGTQDFLVRADPRRYFVPPYVGTRGWLGVRLDVDVDWDELASIIEDAYRMAAPKGLRQRPVADGVRSGSTPVSRTDRR